jgi:hypothetical protein
MEVAQSIQVMQNAKSVNRKDLTKIKDWFSKYLEWVTTHQYGIDEREAKNNHGTCWVMQVAVFAKLTENQTLIDYCKNRFKTVLLPNQMEIDGSFPLELRRTKPYGYALFNLDAMATIAHVLSDKNDNLWEFALPDGRKLKNAIGFMVPYIKDKTSWKLPKDVMYWEEWPVAQPSLIFAYNFYLEKPFFELWENLNHFPLQEEVIRNLPVLISSAHRFIPRNLDNNSFLKSDVGPSSSNPLKYLHTLSYLRQYIPPSSLSTSYEGSITLPSPKLSNSIAR